MTTALVTETTETTNPQPAPCVDTVTCPDCGQPAVVVWRTTIQSTGLPVEHVKISCPAGHWYFMPTEGLTEAVATQDAVA